MTPLEKVLKELNKHFEKEVILETEPMYIFDGEEYEEFTFYYGESKTDMNGSPYMKKRIIVIGQKDEITFNESLPPKLVKLIATFFEENALK